MKLDEWRKKHGLSVAGLSKLLNRNPMTVRRYESQETRPQSEDDYEAVYMATNGKCEPNDFFPMKKWREKLKIKSLTSPPISDQ